MTFSYRLSIYRSSSHRSAVTYFTLVISRGGTESCPTLLIVEILDKAWMAPQMLRKRFSRSHSLIGAQRLQMCQRRKGKTGKQKKAALPLHQIKLRSRGRNDHLRSEVRPFSRSLVCLSSGDFEQTSRCIHLVHGGRNAARYVEATDWTYLLTLSHRHSSLQIQAQFLGNELDSMLSTLHLRYERRGSLCDTGLKCQGGLLLGCS